MGSPCGLPLSPCQLHAVTLLLTVLAANRDEVSEPDPYKFSELAL